MGGDHIDIETMILNIIANAGEAKSLIYLALNEAENGNKDKATEMISKAKELLLEVHKTHAELFSDEYNFDEIDNKHLFLLVHAEDLFMSTMSESEIASHMISFKKER